ncbi:MAG: STAS domain-containing protein [Bacteroidota bacterium]
MQITHTRSDNISIVSINGNLLSADDSTKRQTVVKQQLSNGIKRFILDLKDVQFLNSLGLGSILSAYTSIKKEGGELVLANIDLKVMQILTITQSNKIFTICSNLENAKKRLSD